jgi:ParB family chromosome partitioning protein
MTVITTDDWFTPLFLLNKVQEFYGGDFLDPASSDLVAPYVKASWHYTQKDDGLSQEWEGKVWLNPPYSKPLITQFTEKLLEEYRLGNVDEVLLLVNSCTETKWFQRIASEAYLRIDVKGRLHFWHPQKKSDSPRYGQSLFYFNKEKGFSVRKKFANTFGDLGIMLLVVNPEDLCAN